MFNSVFLFSSALAALGLLFIVYSRSYNNLSGRLFMLILGLIIGYLASHGVHFFLMAPGDLSILDKSCHSFLLLINLSLTLFTIVYPNKDKINRSALTLLLLPSLIILYLLWTDYLIIESEMMHNDFLPQYSKYYVLFIIWYLSLIIISTMVLFSKYKRSNDEKLKMQYLFLLIGLIVTNFTTFFIGIFIPWVTSVYYLIEISPLAFLLGLLLFTAAGISKFDMFPNQLERVRNFGINKKVLLIAVILIPITLMLIQIPIARLLFDFDVAENNKLLLLSMLGSFLVSITMATLINLIVSGPLQELKHNALQIKEGNYKTRAKIQTNDEFGELAETFNSMTEALAEKELIEKKLINSEKLAALGEMAAVLAHEIKTPLTSIKLNIDILNETIRFSSDEKLAFDIMQKEISRLNFLVKDVLQFSKSSPLVLMEFDLKELITESIFQLSQKIKQKNIEIITPPFSFFIVADKEKIKQTLLNLISNAVDAVYEFGKIYIMLSESNERFFISIINDGDYIKDKDKIFEPFYSTKSSGTGLGLVISRKIAEQHGGSLICKENNGKIEFVLELKKVIQ